MRIKCPHCNGKGFSEINSAVNMTCGWCMGQGELDLEIVPTEPQTEQEYLQTCTTEQLADVLWEQINGAFNSGYACCNLKQDKDYVGRYKRFKEWLKQPHTNE